MVVPTLLPPIQLYQPGPVFISAFCSGRASPSKRVLEVPSVTLAMLILTPNRVNIPRAKDGVSVLPWLGLLAYPGTVRGLSVEGYGSGGESRGGGSAPWSEPLQNF